MTSSAVMVCPAPLRVTPFGIVSVVVVSQSPVKVMTPATGAGSAQVGGAAPAGSTAPVRTIGTTLASRTNAPQTIDTRFRHMLAPVALDPGIHRRGYH